MAKGITELLHAAGSGDDAARSELFERLYDELYERARGLMHRQGSAHTLQPTALVHEAYLRLARQRGVHWCDRAHFLAFAAHAMRSALVDHARGKGRRKRGGDARQVSLGSLYVGFNDRALDLLALDEALERLERRDVRAARVVEMRFFGGLDVAEVARLMEVSSRTIERDWELARAWLYRELSR